MVESDVPSVTAFITCECGHDQGHPLDDLLEEEYTITDTDDHGVVVQCPHCWEHKSAEWGRIHHEGDGLWFTFDLAETVSEPDEWSHMFQPYIDKTSAAEESADAASTDESELDE